MSTLLVKAAQKGDQKALEFLLKEHYQQLYKTAFIYCKNEADALDVVQESVIKIITKIGTLKKSEYFTTWAVRIVIFTSLDYFKKQGKTDFLEDQTVILEAEQTNQEALLDISNGLRILPENLQTITILYYFHERKIQEISQVLDEPIGTIKYKLSEARKLLRQYLGGGIDDET